MTDFVLQRTVGVSPDPGRDDYEPGVLYQLEGGTPLDEIPESELAQLAPDHFVGVDDPDARPDDWRTNPVTLEHDKRQAAGLAKEAKERERARREAHKAAGNGG